MLKLDFIDHKTADFACKNWHYSKCMPCGKTVKIRVWEDSKFIGVVIFARGANCNQAKFFKLKTEEIAELARVALRTHKIEVSRILKISLILLRKICPKLKLVFSYADETNQGHKGGIYKADNWEYLGVSISKGGHLMLNGKLVHNRSISSKYGNRKNIPSTINIKECPPQKKHLFIKRFCDNSEKRSRSADQRKDSGAIPTLSLHSNLL